MRRRFVLGREGGGKHQWRDFCTFWHPFGVCVFFPEEDGEGRAELCAGWRAGWLAGVACLMIGLLAGSGLSAGLLALLSGF